MRYLILSDIHGNLDALLAVLRRVRRKRFDSIVLLGDLVGYGAAPNQVLDTVRELKGEVHVLRGNHDKVAAGLEEGLGFNAIALTSARWTQEHLSATNRRFLERLPVGPLHFDGFLACHGSPQNEDTYVFTEREAVDVFRGSDFPLCFFGHTHIACCFSYEGAHVEARLLQGKQGVLDLVPGVRYFINPGAIGQPRDRDPRAAFAIYDSDKRQVSWARTSYPIAKAQKRIVRAGLPVVLAERLALGR